MSNEITIAIDYDHTFTAAPALWCLFVGTCKTMSSVRVICVTGRSPADPISDPRLSVPVVYSDGKLKREAAEAAGYSVDIWIDDEPGTVERCRILEW